MTNTFQLRRAVIYLLILPLSLLVGYLLVDPTNSSGMMMIGGIVFIGCLPLLMKWHHPLLIISWNATVNAFFLPGQPSLWIFMAFLSLFLSIWQRTISRKATLVRVPFLWWPLIFLTLVVIITAQTRGGTGLQSFGSGLVGGKRYFSIIAAIVGFFALSYQSIPRKRVSLYAGLFFLSGITAVMSDIIYLAGPKFYLLFYLFPAGLAMLQAAHDMIVGDSVMRIEGVAWASVSFSCFLLLRYGVRGILDLRRPGRMLVFALTVLVGLFGGFRGRLFLIGAFFIFQFCYEGLWRTRWVAILLCLGILGGSAILPFTEKLPEPFQRAISFLPVEVSPAAKRSAEESTMWRLDMWHVLWPEVPKYFWLGKGYSYSLSDYYLTQIAEARGLAPGYESFILVAEYHNGFLSIMVPFGIWGGIGFLWFALAGWWALYNNYRYGDESLKKINTLFLTYYTVRLIFFFLIYGAFYAELCLFTGVLGLSIAVNGGVKRKTTTTRVAAANAPCLEEVAR